MSGHDFFADRFIIDDLSVDEARKIFICTDRNFKGFKKSIKIIDGFNFFES